MPKARDFINNLWLDLWRSKSFLAAFNIYQRVELRTRSLYSENILGAFNHKLIVPHTSVMWKIQALRLNLLEKSCLHQSSWRLLCSINSANEQGGSRYCVRCKRRVSALFITSPTPLLTFQKFQASRDLHWFQFYCKDDGINRHIMDRVKAEGHTAIVLTADATVGVRQSWVQIKRNGFVFPVGMPIVEEYLPEGAGKSMDFVYKSKETTPVSTR